MAAAAIIAAAISAAATAYSADQQDSASLMGQAKTKGGGGLGGGSPFSPSADQFKKFSPGIIGMGDGSMPPASRADSPIDKLGMQPKLEGQVAGPAGSVFTPQADFRAPDTAQAPTAAPADPSAAAGTGSTNATMGNISQYAQTGLSLAQMLQGSSPQPGPVAQVGGQGYQPTAMQAIAAMAARKRQMGY